MPTLPPISQFIICFTADAFIFINKISFSIPVGANFIYFASILSVSIKRKRYLNYETIYPIQK
jgi:hypothetical protein